MKRRNRIRGQNHLPAGGKHVFRSGDLKNPPLALPGRSVTIICGSTLPQQPRGTVAAADLRSPTSQSESLIFGKNEYVIKLNQDRKEFMNGTGELHFDPADNCFRAETPRIL